MATEIQTIKASQLVELTEVTDSNYVVVTDGATSKKVKATNLKGSSLTSTQAQQLSVAYAHSQTAHVQSGDIPTRTSQLTNDSNFATETYVTNAINNAQLGGGNTDVDLSAYQLIQDNALTTTAKTIPTAINELKDIIDALQNRVTALENQQSTNDEYTQSCTSEYILDKMYPMGQAHEAIPSGLITDTWKYNSRWENQTRHIATAHNCGQSGCPGTGPFQALGCWASVYRV